MPITPRECRLGAGGGEIGAPVQADIDNKPADTAYRHGLLRYEPWRLAFTAFGAGAAVMAALVALLGYFGHH